MSDSPAHDRSNFDEQGEAFLRAQRADSESDYAANRPPHTSRLDGLTITIAYRDDPGRFRHVFTETEVQAERLADSSAADAPPPATQAVLATRRHAGSGGVAYEAFEVAPDLVFVSFLADQEHSVALALDLGSGAATVVAGELNAEGIVSTVQVAHIEEIVGEGPVAYHEPCSLGGTRLRQIYDDDVIYEHIYLTGVYETWLGVAGPEAGQADTEEYRGFKLRDGVYLVYWNEGILTVQMTFLFDLFHGRSVGEVFARADGETVRSTIGARTELIHTLLPELPGVIRLDVFAGG